MSKTCFTKHCWMMSYGDILLGRKMLTSITYPAITTYFPSAQSASLSRTERETLAFFVPYCSTWSTKIKGISVCVFFSKEWDQHIYPWSVRQHSSQWSAQRGNRKNILPHCFAFQRFAPQRVVQENWQIPLPTSWLWSPISFANSAMFLGVWDLEISMSLWVQFDFTFHVITSIMAY